MQPNVSRSESEVQELADSIRFVSVTNNVMVHVPARMMTRMLAITARMIEITARREETQPIREKTSGSTFKNPHPEKAGGRSAWQLVDLVGGRGRRVGGARFSEMHANFLINDGTATAEDLETLVEQVREDIREQTGIDMEWEVRRLGRRQGG